MICERMRASTIPCLSVLWHIDLHAASEGAEGKAGACGSARTAKNVARDVARVVLYRARVLVHSLHVQSSRASNAFFELRQGDIESTKLSIPKNFQKSSLSCSNLNPHACVRELVLRECPDLEDSTMSFNYDRDPSGT